MKRILVMALIIGLGALLPGAAEASGICQRLFTRLGHHLPWVAPRMLTYSVEIKLVSRQTGDPVSRLSFPLSAPQGEVANFSIPLSEGWFPGVHVSEGVLLDVTLRPGRAFLGSGSVELSVTDPHRGFSGGAVVEHENTLTLSVPALPEYSIQAIPKWIEKAVGTDS